MKEERFEQDNFGYISTIQGSVTHSKGKKRGNHRSHVKGAFRRNEFGLHGRQGSGIRHIPDDAKLGF